MLPGKGKARTLAVNMTTCNPDPQRVSFVKMKILSVMRCPGKDAIIERNGNRMKRVGDYRLDPKEGKVDGIRTKQQISLEQGRGASLSQSENKKGRTYEQEC